ncbi:trichohyalin-like [Cyprinodon tularosa]|uniref:trichohyalin-like n=1 Tax=Cyprinodon tularosa TaxID=77115 RepID=UPI0018E1E91B|nr:trichohyalin-like [Cyprinodon tularosa]
MSPVSNSEEQETAVDFFLVPPEYHDLDLIFSESKALFLQPHHPYNCANEPLPGASLPSTRFFNMSKPEKKSMEKYLNKMLDAGVIFISTSPLGADTFYVMKMYQAQCHRLQGQNKDVAANNKVLQDDMPDTLECLQQQEIEKDMSEQVEKQLQVDRKTTKKDLELLISQDRKEMQEMEKQLISVETMLASRIEDQKQQLVNMEQQILKNESLKEMFIQLQDQVKEEKRIKEEKIKPQFEEERKKQSQLKEICQLEEKTELELRKVKSLSQTAIKLRIIAFKQIRQIHSLKETSVKLTKQKDLMMRQINKLQRWKQNNKDIKEAYRQLRAQKVSGVDQLEEKLEQERSRTRELEKDLKRAAFVLRDVAMVMTWPIRWFRSHQIHHSRF